MTPYVVAVNEIVGRTDRDVDVVLLGVELWSARVRLTLAALQNEASDVLLAAWREEFDAWIESDHHGEPPQDPSTALVEEVAVTVESSSGRRFSEVASSSGGSGGEWSATRVLEPDLGGPELVIVFETHAGRHEVRVAALSDAGASPRCRPPGR